MDINDIVKLALPIIFSNEGNYGSVNKDDRGAVSVGKIQWHGNRALNLIKDIIKLNPQLALLKLGNTLYTEITTTKNWSTRILNAKEASLVSKLLTTSNGKKVQDYQMNYDVSSYIQRGQSYGLTDVGALIYFADGINQYGVYATLWRNIAINALKSTGDIEAIYAETKKLTDDHLPRRETVYKKVKALCLDKPVNAITKTSSKEDIKWLQNKLNLALKNVNGYIPLVVDGSYGSKTTAAVIQFYKSQKWVTKGDSVGKIAMGRLAKK